MISFVIGGLILLVTLIWIGVLTWVNWQGGVPPQMQFERVPPMVVGVILALVVAFTVWTESPPPPARQQLVGNWTLVSYDRTAASGAKTQVFGANPKGIIMLDASGRYAVVFGRPDRAKFRDLVQPTTEERAAAFASFGANYGTWSVSEADKTLTLQFEGSLNPNNEGIEAKFTVSLSGDEMKISDAQEIYGPRLDFTWRRAR